MSVDALAGFDMTQIGKNPSQGGAHPPTEVAAIADNAPVACEGPAFSIPYL
jgi:hypothetical protein